MWRQWCSAKEVPAVQLGTKQRKSKKAKDKNTLPSKATPSVPSKTPPAAKAVNRAARKIVEVVIPKPDAATENESKKKKANGEGDAANRAGTKAVNGRKASQSPTEARKVANGAQGNRHSGSGPGRGKGRGRKDVEEQQSDDEGRDNERNSEEEEGWEDVEDEGRDNSEEDDWEAKEDGGEDEDREDDEEEDEEDEEDHEEDARDTDEEEGPRKTAANTQRGSQSKRAPRRLSPPPLAARKSGTTPNATAKENTHKGKETGKGKNVERLNDL